MLLVVLNIIYLNHTILTRRIAAKNRTFDATFGSDVMCRFHSFVPYTCITLLFALLSWLAFDR